MEKIRKPTTNVFRLLLLLIVLITLILSPLCFYSYFYYYGVPNHHQKHQHALNNNEQKTIKHGVSGTTYLQPDNVTFVHSPDYEDSGSSSDLNHLDHVFIDSISNTGAGNPGHIGYNDGMSLLPFSVSCF
jgi:hypothetical protein